MAREWLVATMEGILGPEGVISEHEQLRSYECDGLMNYRVVPDLVVLPETAEHVQKIVTDLPRRGHPLRGAGLGYRALGRGACRSSRASS